jgi:hypothetical protein
MNKNYRTAARDLKKLGLVNYDLRRNLSSGQKSQITKLLGKLADTFGGEKARDRFFTNPEDYQVSRVSPKTQSALVDSGFKVLPNGRAVIPKKGADSVSVSSKGITYKKGKVKTTTIPTSFQDFFPTLKKLSAKKLGRNQMLSVQIGDAHHFQRRFDSYASLYKYLQEEFEPKDPNTDKDELIARISIVTIEGEKIGKKKARPKKVSRP